MIKITSLSAAAALLACGLSAAPAQAGPNRTWVSGTGTDSGACTRAAPCRSFAFALTQTNAGGEIDVLDPAVYGTVTIANDGVGTAGITVGSGGIGVTINAGPSDSVHLRGLTIEGLGSGSVGILFKTGGNLAIENCVVRDFVNVGISITPSTSSSFSVSNTIASNNHNGEGIEVSPSGFAVVTGVLSKVTANNNGFGIFVGGGTAQPNVTVIDSVASNNSNTGITATTALGNPAIIMVRNSVASYNETGIQSVKGDVRVAHSVITGNNKGVDVFPGRLIFSYGDNEIDGNTNNNYGALTTIPTH